MPNCDLCQNEATSTYKIIEDIVNEDKEHINEVWWDFKVCVICRTNLHNKIYDTVFAVISNSGWQRVYSNVGVTIPKKTKQEKPLDLAELCRQKALKIKNG